MTSHHPSDGKPQRTRFGASVYRAAQRAGHQAAHRPAHCEPLEGRRLFDTLALQLTNVAGELPLTSVDFKITANPSSGGTGTPGKPTLGDVIIDADGSTASPGLMAVAATGRRYQFATLIARTDNGVAYSTIILSDAFVTGYGTAASGGATADHFSLAYTKISWSYLPGRVAGGAARQGNYDSTTATGSSPSFGDAGFAPPPSGASLTSGSAGMNLSGYDYAADAGFTAGPLVLTAPLTESAVGLTFNAALGRATPTMQINNVATATSTDQWKLTTVTVLGEHITFGRTGATQAVTLGFRQIDRTYTPAGGTAAVNSINYLNATASGTPVFPASAANTYGLQLSGITGELPLTGMDWQITNADPLGTGAGGGGGKPVPGDFVLDANGSTASPGLMAQAAFGRHYTTAVLVARTAAGLAYSTITLTNAVISSYAVTESGAATPKDHFALSFDKIAWSYLPGRVSGVPRTGDYDIRTNTGSAPSPLVNDSGFVAGAAGTSLTIGTSGMNVDGYDWANNGTKPGPMTFTAPLTESAVNLAFTTRATATAVLNTYATAGGRNYDQWTLSTVGVLGEHITFGPTGATQTFALTFNRVTRTYTPPTGAATTATIDYAAGTASGTPLLPAAANNTYGLQLAGVNGELPLVGMDWTITAGTPSGGTGAGGVPTFGDFVLDADGSVASTGLMARVTLGTRFTSATLIARTSGGLAYSTITLTNVLVSAYQVIDHDGTPGDHFALRFTKIAWSYLPGRVTGTARQGNYDVQIAAGSTAAFGDANFAAPADGSALTINSAGLSLSGYTYAADAGFTVGPLTLTAPLTESAVNLTFNTALGTRTGTAQLTHYAAGRNDDQTVLSNVYVTGQHITFGPAGATQTFTLTFNKADRTATPTTGATTTNSIDYVRATASGLPQFPNAASITGAIFADTNNNGVQDTGENVLASVPLFLDANGNGYFDAGEPTAASDTLGVFAFANLAAGLYALRPMTGSGYQLTALPPGQPVARTGTLGTGLIGLKYRPWFVPVTGTPYAFNGNTLTITGGATAFTGDIATTDPAMAVALSNAAALTLSGTQHVKSLSLADTSTATLATGGAAVLTVNTLSVLDTARLDLADGGLIVDYDTVPQAAAVAALIASGRSGGTWTGPGITSTAARTNPAHTTALGLLASADYKALYGTAARFLDETIDPTAVLVRYTLYGDTDLDRGVSINDFNRLSTSFGVATGKFWLNGDLDYDSGVSINDFNLLSANFGKTLIV